MADINVDKVLLALNVMETDRIVMINRRDSASSKFVIVHLMKEIFRQDRNRVCLVLMEISNFYYYHQSGRGLCYDLVDKMMADQVKVIAPVNSVLDKVKENRFHLNLNDTVRHKIASTLLATLNAKVASLKREGDETVYLILDDLSYLFYIGLDSNAIMWFITALQSDSITMGFNVIVNIRIEDDLEGISAALENVADVYIDVAAFKAGHNQSGYIKVKSDRCLTLYHYGISDKIIPTYLPGETLAYILGTKKIINETNGYGNQITRALDVKETTKFVLIKEHDLADSSFIIRHLIRQIFQDDRNRLCLVLLQNSLCQYHLDETLSDDMTKRIEDGQVITIKPMETLDVVNNYRNYSYLNTVMRSEIMKALLVTLKTNMDSLKGDGDETVYLIIDDLSYLSDMGVNFNTMIEFITALQSYSELCGCKVILNMSVGDNIDKKIGSVLEYFADVQIDVTTCTTALRQVSGIFNVNSSEGNRTFYYNLANEEILTFMPGELLSFPS